MAKGLPGALRFRVRADRIKFDDLVRGEVEIDTANLGGDFVIVRGNGTPLYHFTVVVDDAAMEISHIIRGEDHLSNTPKHILLFQALGHEVPKFAHLPLILNPDRTKMSKRKSQTAIADYRAQGFVPEAMVNFLSLLGWSTGTEEEILTLDELAGRFDLEHVQKGGAVFDKDRLEWLNGQWIRKLSPEELIERLQPSLEADLQAGRIDRLPSAEELRALVPIIQERLPTLGSIGDLVGFLWVDKVAAGPGDARAEALGPPDDPRRPAGRARRRSRARSAPSPSRRTSSSRRCARSPSRAAGRRATCSWPIRVAVTGRTATPPLFDSLVALGRDRVLERLDAAIDTLAGLEDAA